ncbi:MAG: HEAT repeat domain-containing protein [Nannocystaceae bacterium]
MRKLLSTAFVAAMLCALPGCQEPDPNMFESHVGKLEDPDARAEAFNALERLAKSVATSGNEARGQEFADKVLPVFETIWDDAKEFRVKMLELARAVKRPEAAGIWAKAIVLDGTSDGHKAAVLALQGIRDAKAVALVEPIVAQFEVLMADPSKDKGKLAGQIRLEYAKTLGALGEKKAAPVLIKALEQSAETQPVAVHKEATKSLGLLRDPSAVDALLLVQFRVPDSASTQNIGERAKQALTAIGAPAVAPVLKMLRGEHEAVNKLAASNGVEVKVVKQAAAGILGAMGNSQATADLVAYMPKAGCEQSEPKKKKRKKRRRKKKGKKKVEKVEPDAEAAHLRAFVARALGTIGDEKAVDALCSCRNATHNPVDLWEITTALGRIGGDAAFKCLTDIVKNGEYDPDVLVNSDFRYEIRWGGGRFLVLAASPGQLGKVRKVFAGQTDPKVKAELAQWEPGMKVLEDCKADQACYTKVLSDTTAEWFAREKAATELARIAAGDPAAALAVAKAFKVRDPGARVTMAWLVSKMMGDKSCPECAAALEAVMKGEKGTADSKMQMAWLTARQTIARLR